MMVEIGSTYALPEPRSGHFLALFVNFTICFANIRTGLETAPNQPQGNHPNTPMLATLGHDYSPVRDLSYIPSNNSNIGTGLEM